MPLVRISHRKGNPAGFGKKVGEVVFQSMQACLNVPAQDHFQIIVDHDENGLIYDPSYLGISRSDGIVVIQITLNEGRTVELKKKFYQAVADGLHTTLQIRKEDVFINLIEVKKENWSFGNGIAQYAE